MALRVPKAELPPEPVEVLWHRPFSMIRVNGVRYARADNPDLNVRLGAARCVAGGGWGGWRAGD
jgi:hypothetical protein